MDFMDNMDVMDGVETISVILFSWLVVKFAFHGCLYEAIIALKYTIAFIYVILSTA